MTEDEQIFRLLHSLLSKCSIPVAASVNNMQVDGPTDRPTERQTDLRHHVLKRLHDATALGFLVVREDAGDDDDARQHHT